MNWRRDEVRMIHEPTGLTATSNEGHAPPSHHRMRRAALAMLRGKLFARSRGLGGPLPLVRTYVIPAGEHTTPTLETGAAIDDDTRRRSYAPQCDVCRTPLGVGWCSACSAEEDARDDASRPVTILGASGGMPE